MYDLGSAVPPPRLHGLYPSPPVACPRWCGSPASSPIQWEYSALKPNGLPSTGSSQLYVSLRELDVGCEKLEPKFETEYSSVTAVTMA